MIDLMIYGATGYTGTLVAEHAAAMAPQPWSPPTLAGRNQDEVKAHPTCLEMPRTAFDLADAATRSIRPADVRGSGRRFRCDRRP